MAQLISVKLSRFDGSPWGFRLQGGKDFGTPLIVQKVNNGSPAEAAGLRAGDSVIKVNNIDVFNLRHKDAQDVIRGAGNNFEVTVQRGGTTWRPSVSPVTASIPSPQPSAPIGNISPVTRTSLAHKKQDVHHIGSGHNFSPKPFLNGTSDGPIKSIVNKQYNSPVGIYSEETIAETLSAQAEVLAGGVLGVNFKKNEKNYNAQNSEVFKMVQEADKEPRTPEPAEPASQSGVVTPTSPALSSLRPVQAPETRPQPSGGSQGNLPPGQNICAECERLIVGVFVRIKEKNLHVECFKCSTCGTSLKNVGYYNINNKLYCDIHAKLAARQNAPAGVIPTTVAPGHRGPANTISAALGSHVGPLSPSLSNHGSSSPQPFISQQQQCNRTYSPETSYRNGYNSYVSSNNYSNRTSPEDSTNTNGLNYNERTYTSTLTIQRSDQQLDENDYKQQQQQQQLDYNRNPTNFNHNHNNIDNKLHKLADEIRDFAFDRNKEVTSPSYDQNDFCVRNTTSDISILRAALKAPTTNNFGGPKPFIGSSITNQNYNSSPIINTGSSTLPRPQSQSVTGRFSTLPKPKVSPFKENSYYEECCERRQSDTRTRDQPTLHEEYNSYELVREVCRPRATEKPPTPRNIPKWPPVKPIEDITYPTASPLYIDPNPTIDQRTRQVNQERRATVESVIKKRTGSKSADRMSEYSCQGQNFRSVELVNSEKTCTRTSRCQSRASSCDSMRRSLTPTKITQPTPRPWTASVTASTNVYQSVAPPQPSNICESFCQKEVCQREKVCQRSPSPAPRHREEHYHSEEDSCKTEGDVHRHEHTTSKVCKFICEPEPEPEPPQPPQQEEEERVDYSKLVPPDVAVCPKGIDAEHDMYTETEEEDKGNLHIKKTTTYEKTVELVSPDREIDNAFARGGGQDGGEEYAQRSSTVDREVESFSERRQHVCGRTSEASLTKTIDTAQMVEEAKRQEEEERRRRAEEERRQQEEEERKRQEEERQIAEMHRREEERRRQKEAEDRQRREEEERRIREEEASRSGPRATCRRESKCEVTATVRCPSRERIIEVQLECPTCGEPHPRPPSRERVIPIKMEGDEPPPPPPQCKTEIREFKEEVNIKQQDYEEQRRKSIREQVEVHKSLRDQQSPAKRQPTLQERRLSSRMQGGQSPAPCTKKHVQFVKQTETGVCPLDTPVENAKPNPWQSEMCKALTTASERPYSPLVTAGKENRQIITREVTIEKTSVCPICNCPPRPTSPFVQALTTASDRPYSPLGRQAQPVCTCKCRSKTPELKTTYEGYAQPSELLFRNPPKDPPKMPDGPRPLPTPPPDFKFRNRSVSPSCRSKSPCSRSQTPSGRVSACGLKKPDAIPDYQKYLVCEEQVPVQSQEFPGRTPTPCCPEPPTCYVAKLPQRDTTTPDKTETTHYHLVEDTPQGHKTKDTVSSKTVSWVGQGSAKHAHYQVHDDTVTEECDGSHHVKTTEHTIREYDDPDQPEEPPVEQSTTCYITQNSNVETTLPCPNAKQNAVMERIQKTGVRVFAGPPEVRRICHEIPPPKPKPPCPMTGVQVLPVRAHGDTSCKSGVVVVPCDGIGERGVCITPTPDRQGVTVTPCPAENGGICEKPSCYCGSSSGKCTTNLGNEKTTYSCNVSTSTTTNTGSNGIPGVRSVSCPKPILKCLGASKAKLPFPQIPLPDEEDEPPCHKCPLAPPPPPPRTSSSSITSFSTETRECGFQPIQQQPRTNLCNQITTLTLCKRETSCPKPPSPIPTATVQLYKPCPPPPPCRTSSSQIKTQTIQKQNRFRRETTTSQSSSSSSAMCNQSQSSCCLSSKTQSSVDPPNLGSSGGFGGGNKGGTFAGSSAPNRGRGILNQAGSGVRVPQCAACNSQVRGPFISALGQIWCPEHFVCGNSQCRRHLQDIGFVEEKGQLYCEYCFEKFIAPPCSKCNNKIKGDCLNAIGKHFHPECFNCTHCGKLFGNSPFFLEEGLPYCERDWNDLFTTKCFACGFPVEAGDRWVEALNNNYHSQCFNCTMCKQNLEGQSFYAKNGRPFCKNHAR